ncbi:MAG: protein kinase [Kiritimatiellae bacterium]|nr:protein kinase [Kiritimatiellia bacterium]
MEGENLSFILTDPVNSAACPKCGMMLDVSGLPSFASVQCPSCEFEFEVPARLGPFLLLQLLGAGGMGGVYRARDEALKREVAIKVMLKKLGDDPQFVQTFQREAQAAAKLNHPNIAQIYSFGQEKGQPYIVMELVSGGSLDQMIAEQGALPPAVVMHVGAQIAEGLQEAADAGMVHGDVKPENILFDNDKNAKLVDFGLSAMASGPGNDVWGTPYYIAPEKVRRQKIDHRSDIYSLGGTLYHAIAGVPPFEGEDATAVVKARFESAAKPMKEIRAGVPDEVEAIVARMLSPDPQTRYPTYGSLLGDMRRYLAKAGPVKIKKSGKKIVIKGKKVTTGQMSMTGPNKVTGMLADSGDISDLHAGTTPLEEIEQAEESAEEAGRRGRKIILSILGVIVLVAGSITGGVYGFKKYSAGKRQKAEIVQIEQSQAKARTAIAKSVETAREAVDRVRKYVPEALGYAAAAADEAVKAFGEDARQSMIPPEGEPAAKEDKQPAAADASKTEEKPKDGGADKGGAEKPAAEAAAKTEEKPKDGGADKGGAEKPAAEAAAKTEEKPKDGGADKGGAEKPAAEAAADEHPVIAIVRAMYAEAYAVKQGAAYAEQCLAEVDALAKKAEGMTQVDKESAEELVKTANKLVETVRGIGYDRRVSEIPRRISQLKRSLESVKTDVAALLERRREDAAEAERRRQAEAAAEKKRQEEEARKVKVAAEIAAVGDAAAASLEDLKQLRFREVAAALRKAGSGLETSEGLKALDVALDRISRVKEFHEHIVKSVEGFKSSRGWSVDGADQRTLSVGGRKILWAEVYNQRIDIVGELVGGLVLDEQATDSLRLREKTRLMTNAAVCLNLFYKDIPSAQERAKDMAVDAARLFELDAEEIRQLLPEFF